MFLQLLWAFFSAHCTAALTMYDLSSPLVAVFSSFSGSHQASISTGSDYMNLNWPQFNTSVDSRWLLPLKSRLAKTPAGWAATEKTAPWNHRPANLAERIKALARWELSHSARSRGPGTPSVLPKMTEINR